MIFMIFIELSGTAECILKLSFLWLLDFSGLSDCVHGQLRDLNLGDEFISKLTLPVVMQCL